jgi:outer membrane protein OmpA-like peptidoglycan-associated protein
LKWTTGSPTGALQVVQITYPTALPAPQIEQSLEESGRAEIHGIYFDFGSATIKSESEPVLKEIADAIGRNPAWKLSVEGHTDNIGTDAANLDLSRRRADAVRQALTTRYRVDAAKLTAAGFGAARPKEPNDTPEGRARNRRVELVRQ